MRQVAFMSFAIHTYPNRGARLLLSRYLVSYNRPSRSIMTLFSLVPRLKRHRKDAQAHLFLFWQHTPSLLLSAIGIILKRKGKKLCDKNYRSVNFQSFCEKSQLLRCRDANSTRVTFFIILVTFKAVGVKKENEYL